MQKILLDKLSLRQIEGWVHDSLRALRQVATPINET